MALTAVSPEQLCVLRDCLGTQVHPQQCLQDLRCSECQVLGAGFVCILHTQAGALLTPYPPLQGTEHPGFWVSTRSEGGCVTGCGHSGEHRAVASWPSSEAPHGQRGPLSWACPQLTALGTGRSSIAVAARGRGRVWTSLCVPSPQVTLSHEDVTAGELGSPTLPLCQSTEV